MNSTFTGKRRLAVGAVATVGLAVAALGAGAGAAQAAALAGTLNVSSGPSTGGNTLSLTVPSTKFASGATVEYEVGTACTAAYSAAVTVTTTAGVVVGGTVHVLSGTKIVTTVPAGVALTGSQTSAPWLVCAYPGSNTTTSLLAASAKYTIAARPTAVSIAPTGGPALGGGTVTVTGTNFITGMTATLGGLPLTGISIIDSSHFTAVAAAHTAATGVALALTTTGGTATLVSAYTYSNGIVISPVTTPTATAATDIDVQGVGFSTLTFTTTDGTTEDDNNAHVYLVAGVYNPAVHSSAKTVGEAGECLNVLVISDTELICTVDTLNAYGAANSTITAAIPTGLYTVTVVSDGGVDVQAGGTGYTGGTVTAGADPNYAASIISSGSTFTVAPY